MFVETARDMDVVFDATNLDGNVLFENHAFHRESVKKMATFF